MRYSVYCSFLGVFLLLISAARAWAQDDLFEGTPSPTPSFMSDHSYDDSDVDGTSLKLQNDSDDNNQSSSDDEDGYFKKSSNHDTVKSKEKKESDDQDADSDSTDQGSNGL